MVPAQDRRKRTAAREVPRRRLRVWDRMCVFRRCGGALNSELSARSTAEPAAASGQRSVASAVPCARKASRVRGWRRDRQLRRYQSFVQSTPARRPCRLISSITQEAPGVEPRSLLWLSCAARLPRGLLPCQLLGGMGHDVRDGALSRPRQPAGPRLRAALGPARLSDHPSCPSATE